VTVRVTVTTRRMRGLHFGRDEILLVRAVFEYVLHMSTDERELIPTGDDKVRPGV
jgi:hypothetical protein